MVLMLEAWSRYPSRALFVCGAALPNLSSARFPTKCCGLDKTSVRFEPCLLYNMTPHCYPYQFGARILRDLTQWMI
jgi:hypothetical protein